MYIKLKQQWQYMRLLLTFIYSVFGYLILNIDQVLQSIYPEKIIFDKKVQP